MDMIDRQAAIKDAKSWVAVDEYEKHLQKNVVEWLKELPSAEPQECKGKWIHREDMDFLDENKVKHIHFMCSECGLIHDFLDWHTAQYNFCPNCGCKMEVEK